MPAEDSSPATKANIQRLDKKVDGLDNKFTKLGIELVKTHGKMDRMKDDILRRIDEGNSNTAATIGAFLKKLEIYDRESATLPAAIDKHGEKLRDHETRIKTLETR